MAPTSTRSSLWSVVKIVNRINPFPGIRNGNILSNLMNVHVHDNAVKRKLERFVNNTIVVKNPIPDELTKPAESRLPTNTYLNK